MPFSHAIHPIVAVGLPTLAALVWAALAQGYCRCHGTARPEGGLLRLFQALGWLFALHYGGKAVVALYPPAAFEAPAYLAACLVAEVSSIVVLPILRHLVRLGVLGNTRPGTAWLSINYGLAGVALLDVDPRADHRYDLFEFYLLGLSLLILWDLVQMARARRRPLLMADLGFRGYLVLALCLLVGVVVLVATEQTGREQGWAWTLSHGFVGLAAAVPFVLRILGEVLRGVILFALRLGLGLGFAIGFRQIPVALAGFDVGTQRSLELLLVLLLVVAVGPGARWLGSMADGLVLHRSDRWRNLLQSGLQSLDPEADLDTLGRHAVRQLTRVLRLRGAALWFPGRGEPATAGALDIARVVEHWPQENARVDWPEGVFDALWVRDPELQEAMLAARVTWVCPVSSSQRHWGYFFVSAGLLGNAATHAKLETLRDYAHELGLRCDVAELLVRARRVERTLAQRDKLAALGETAARLAHEIRNPVTAARSLAQLLADEPMSPLNAEHAGLVVRELDRVEHQVQAMLQLTRQEAHQPEALRLEPWLRSTLDDLGTCRLLDGIELEVDLDPRPVVEADAERLRQVLVNVLTNAADAVGEEGEAPWIGVTLRLAGAGVELVVADNGPGIGETIEPRLFEPFVSSKTRGTGLGLTIARRIVEAHGGRIEARPRTEGGTEVLVWLPRQAEEALGSTPDPPGVESPRMEAEVARKPLGPPHLEPAVEPG